MVNEINKISKEHEELHQKDGKALIEKINTSTTNEHKQYKCSIEITACAGKYNDSVKLIEDNIGGIMQFKELEFTIILNTEPGKDSEKQDIILLNKIGIDVNAWKTTGKSVLI